MWRDKRTKLIAALLILFVIPSAVFAGKSKANVFVGKDEVIDGNYVAAGEQVIIEGVVKGDVIVAGGVVVVSGPVSGDVIAAGGQVRVMGPVSGDIRLAGGDVQVASIVEKNATVFGGNVQFLQESVIGESAMVFAGNFDAMGTIDRNLRAGVGALKLSGTVKEHAWLKVGEPNQFILQPQAWVGGDLRYTSPTAAEVMSGATINGEVDYTGIDQRKVKQALGVISFGALLAIFLIKLSQLLGLLIFGFVVLWLVPKHLGKVTKQLQKEFWPSFARGLVATVLVPISLFIIALTLIGLPVAIVGAAIYLIALFYGTICLCTFVGEWILKKISGKRWRGVSQRWSMVLGVVLFFLVISIPGFGLLFKWLILASGLGALLVVWQGDLKKLS